MEAAQVLGNRYRLDRQLGEGGMSVVWAARDEILGRLVAVKVLATRFAKDEASRHRIRAEAQAAARLSHPNITSVYDYGESVDEAGDIVPYIVMELLPGLTLADRLGEGPLRPRLGLRICAEVASALAAAHREDLVHRDVKPANVVLTPDGAKVVDFGIAAAVGQLDDTDANSPILGTPAYLAPERLTGGEVVAASDVYALGLLIFRVFTDRLPWQVETTTQMLTAHVYVEPAALPPVAGLPPAVSDIYRRCVTKDPADRPPAGEVAQALAAAGGFQLRPADDDSSVTFPASSFVRPEPRDPNPDPTSGLTARPGPSKRGRRRILAVVAAVAVLAVAALGIMLSGYFGGGAPQAAGQTRGARNGDANGGPLVEPANNQTGVAAGSVGPSGRNNPGTPAPVPAGPNQLGTTPADGAPATTPPNVAPTTPGVVSSPTPPAITLTLRSAGGTVDATCQGTVVSLDPATLAPADGYKVKNYIAGPDTVVGVVFKVVTASGSNIRMKIRCKNGAPVTNNGAE